MAASEIRVDELVEFSDSLARDLMKSHERRFAERMKLVRDASLGLHNATTKLVAGVKSAWGTLDKTATEYAMRLAQIIQETAQDLSQEEAASNYQDTEGFHTDSVQALNKIIITVRKYVPKLHRALKPEMSALSSSLGKLENSIKSLGTALDESPGIKLDSLRRDVQLLLQRQDEVSKLRSQEHERTVAFEAASNREKELLAEKQTLLLEPEFLELKRYEDSSRLKEDEIKQFLQPLTKPLLKLERVASSKQASPIDTKTLRNLIETPVETIVAGQSFAITKLLSILEETLNLGQLGVEERKRRKATETIKAIKDGAFDKMREEYLTLQANVQETLRQLKGKGLLEKRDTMDEVLAQTRAQKDRVIAQQRDLRRKIDELNKNILKQKTSLETQISKLTQRPITISVG